NMGDAIAHLARPDDAYFFDRHIRLVSLIGGTIGRAMRCCNAKPPPDRSRGGEASPEEGALPPPRFARLPRGIFAKKKSPEVFGGLKLFGEFRDGSEEITDQAVIGDLEDRGFLVLVDGDDDFRI